MAYPYLKHQILFNCNGLATWQGLLGIKHIKGNGRLYFEFFRSYPTLKPHILFHSISKGLASYLTKFARYQAY